MDGILPQLANKYTLISGIALGYGLVDHGFEFR
jgi:hypothetical protein